MALNYIWIFLILAAVLVGLVEWIFAGQSNVMTEILNSTFASAKTGFEISIGLTGVLSLWMGIMKIGERAGVINQLSRAVSPFFTRIFPELGKGHPAYGPMLMNLSATMLGIDNAATPLGLQAMQEMQKTNTPFAAGILFRNDMDYQLARLLACDVVTEEPFEEIGDEALERAKELITGCSRVINAGVHIGPGNHRIKELLDFAEAQGKLE